MKSLTAKQIIIILLANGFIFKRQTGSHAIFEHSISHVSVPVPIHCGNRILRIGTFFAIVKQSQLPREKFIKFEK